MAARQIKAGDNRNHNFTERTNFYIALAFSTGETLFIHSSRSVDHESDATFLVDPMCNAARHPTDVGNPTYRVFSHPTDVEVPT